METIPNGMIPTQWGPGQLIGSYGTAELEPQSVDPMRLYPCSVLPIGTVKGSGTSTPHTARLAEHLSIVVPPRAEPAAKGSVGALIV